jgi:two-component system, LuxR family, sensor kinase FixL
METHNHLNQWTILLVDDDYEDYLLVRQMLSESQQVKVNLVWVPNIEDGSAALSTSAFDAVLVDYDLGPCTGIQLIQRWSGSYPAPFILFTGRGSYQVDVEAMQAGAVLYLTKNEVTPFLLERGIRYAIAWKKNERKLERANDLLQKRTHELDEKNRQMESRLSLFELLSNRSQDFFFFIRCEDGAILEVNEAALNAYGYSREEMLSLTIYDLRIPEARTLIPQQIAKAFEGGNMFTTMHKRRDGSTFPVEVRSRGAFVNNQKILVSVVRDISDREEVQQKLYEAYERAEWMARFPHENPSPVMRVSDEGRVLYCNPAAEELFGPDGKNCPGGYQEVIQLARQSMQQTGEIVRELDVGDKNISFSIMSFPDAKYANIYGRDITSIKKAEAELQNYTQQLQNSNKELENFAIIASHDLQEPLRKIKHFSDYVRKRTAGILDETEYDYLERIQRAAERMQRMTEGLLRLAQVSSRGKPFVRVDLEQVADEVLEDLGSMVKKTDGKVELSQLPEIYADPPQMHQLFQNLIGNGLKFHKAGKKPIVKVTGRSINGSGVEVTFEDNGIGFDAENADRLFQPFQRLHSDNSYEGTGIGLSICRKIVERHGGKIRAESRQGAGSKFIVTLPKNNIVISKNSSVSAASYGIQND